MNDPRSLERQISGLTLITQLGAFALADAAGVAHPPWSYRVGCAVFGRIPVLRDIGHVSRFTFQSGRR